MKATPVMKQLSLMSLGPRVVLKAELEPWYSIFDMKFRKCKSFNMYNSISFCITIYFRKWLMECSLKISDASLVHLNCKWLCSLASRCINYQLDEYSIVVPIASVFLVYLTPLRWFNLVWLQEEKGVRKCCVFFQASSLFSHCSAHCLATC